MIKLAIFVSAVLLVCIGYLTYLGSEPSGAFCDVLEQGQIDEQILTQYELAEQELARSVLVPKLGAPLWHDGQGGATYQNFNSAARYSWLRPGGDWLDADGIKWGNTPFAEVKILPSKDKQTIQMDVTELVKLFRDNSIPNNGFYLLATSGIADLVSKENDDIYSHPQLEIRYTTSTDRLVAKMDTHLNDSTIKSMGASSFLKASSNTPVLLWFAPESISENEKINAATLSFTVAKIWGGKPMIIRVFAVAPLRTLDDAKVKARGVAAAYILDCGIDEDPHVYFKEDFEEANWESRWQKDSDYGSVVSLGNPNAGFKPLLGNAFDASLNPGSNLGINQRLKFKTMLGYEPEEAYFRYYIRFGEDWNSSITGGKLPGFAGTYGEAGWGGRRSNGSNGWSARGAFLLNIDMPVNGDLHGKIPLGNYVYHAEQESYWGDSWVWNPNTGGLLEKNRWYSIEQHIKLNSPLDNDGIFRAWVDGRLVFEKNNIRFRSTDDLKLEEVWFNVYHGGSTPSPSHQSLFIDNIVVGAQYIGPMSLTLE